MYRMKIVALQARYAVITQRYRAEDTVLVPEDDTGGLARGCSAEVWLPFQVGSLA